MENIKKDTVTQNRYLFLGGSDMPILFNKSFFKSKKELIESYINKNIESVDTSYTIYGNLMEEKIRNYINEEYGYRFIPACKIKYDKRIRANCDGLCSKKNVVLEVKTNNGKHNNTIDYELQAQLYMYMFDVDGCVLAQYTRPQNFYRGLLYEDIYNKENYDLTFNPTNLKFKTIKRNNKIIEIMLKEIDLFWDIVKKGRKLKATTLAIH